MMKKRRPVARPHRSVKASGGAAFFFYIDAWKTEIYDEVGVNCIRESKRVGVDARRAMKREVR